MKAALIGHTGFVGSWLKSTGGYTHLYNSSNIESIRGERFDAIVCAGTPALKWRANAEPEEDRRIVKRLTDALAEAAAERFFLVSTVDVFASPVAVDETAPVKTESLHPYGLHRYDVEMMVRARFPRHCVMRLPTIFGPGLRKNPVYDLLHDNNIAQIPMDGVFQWYDVRRLPDDMKRAADLPLVHLATAPLPMRRIVEEIFPEKTGVGRAGGAVYDMRTLHAAQLGGSGDYIADAAAVMAQLSAFVADERRRLRDAS